jgi:SAM-dependent methyltransferase
MKPDELQTYYSLRAREYEQIYEKPERQYDLKCLRNIVSSFFSSKTVLEIACGTGYWTKVLADTAEFVTAVDSSEEVLEIARRKPAGRGKVEFLNGDVYCLPNIRDSFTGALAAFWWSHVPKERFNEFLRSFHSPLAKGCQVMLIDNIYVPGNSTAISRTDEHGNTYQNRKLSDGRVYQVLKNFPRRAELLHNLGSAAIDFQFHELEYYWYSTYRVNKKT